MKVYAALLALTAALASACNTCNDCPGDQVCNHFGGFGVTPTTFCVEPSDPSCNDPRGNCDTAACN
ncbi:hypothetical protein CI102_2712 [Trichoderma harzianum]|uniref:SSCRP protein n=1 Tax=Trichoderma harzianum CBS 226.95 TaxID=983964 RepID=A0A2T4AL65_TRIHA|nr:hypothetical protein M431DRAFT_492015 [Trichoderma harzianum CBS 226.95]PKK52804.1 hypothetical protein CI102_2712 [Trichoderma harzianum]PTB57772.1 hypothetical protein M431DRAFT_492015 [Trichoderma harzianum CBS 226.95]